MIRPLTKWISLSLAFTYSLAYGQQESGVKTPEPKVDTSAIQNPFTKKTPDDLNVKEEYDLDVQEVHGDLVLIEKNKNTRYITPKRMLSDGSYIVRINRGKKDDVNPDEKVATQEDKIEARRVMYQANQAFFKGDLEAAWNLIEKAESLDKDYYRIKSMKGSLLYRIGSKDLAVALWQESLAIQPNQPDIVKMLNNTQKELKQ